MQKKINKSCETQIAVLKQGGGWKVSKSFGFPLKLSSMFSFKSFQSFKRSEITDILDENNL